MPSISRATPRGVRKEILHELAAYPVDLAADVFDDVAGLQAVRQYVPGIGLDFKLVRQRPLLVKAQRIGDGEARGAELAKIVEEHRDVDVDAPFARPRIFLEGRNRIVKIEKA